jgi:hypothetical protein
VGSRRLPGWQGEVPATESFPELHLRSKATQQAPRKPATSSVGGRMQQSVDTNTPEGGGCRREVLASTQELDATNATAMDVRSQFVYRYNLSNAASTYTHMAVSQPRRGFPNP